MSHYDDYEDWSEWGRCIHWNSYPIHRGFQEHEDWAHPPEHCSHGGCRPGGTSRTYLTDETAWQKHLTTCTTCQADMKRREEYKREMNRA